MKAIDLRVREELETLLGLLDGALMIDRRSIWQIAGKKLSDNVAGGHPAIWGADAGGHYRRTRGVGTL
jgi:hypothetical protein